MDPITAANYLATLVGLICNWKAERGAQATDNFEGFLNYLLVHHFETLRSEILQSNDLQSQLQKLLSTDMAFIAEQLALLSRGVASLASKIDSFEPLTRILGVSDESLSRQAVDILKAFDQSGAVSMGRVPGSNTFQFFGVPGNRGVRASETRFLDADIRALLSFGFIQHEMGDASQYQAFVITRLGSHYAAKLRTLNYSQGEH